MNRCSILLGTLLAGLLVPALSSCKFSPQVEQAPALPPGRHAAQPQAQPALSGNLSSSNQVAASLQGLETQPGTVHLVPLSRFPADRANSLADKIGKKLKVHLVVHSPMA